jgi:hypothetical protein
LDVTQAVCHLFGIGVKDMAGIVEVELVAEASVFNEQLPGREVLVDDRHDIFSHPVFDDHYVIETLKEERFNDVMILSVNTPGFNRVMIA